MTPVRRIAFLGLGLIGGSIARALRERPTRSERGIGVDERIELVAWSPSGDGPAAAFAAGVIDANVDDPVRAVEGADLVVLAGPALRVVEAIRALAPMADGRTALGPTTTVTDVASTKVAVIDAADEARLPVVGGHPMAGRESSGFPSADPSLFVDRPWVVVPGRHARGDDIERVEWLARAVGARPITATAADHDAAVAAISHLPLVVAAALAEAVAGGAEWASSLGHELASGGWLSSTRVARGEPSMGASILATNARPTATAIRSFRAALDDWLEALETEEPDVAAIRDRLARARFALER
ncbi:MAG TPA: prephenate dehydrogenase/arogenate dehydrogenase family protein [Candidatus Limnocylindrales bacterium]|nr:prephenate dehydrogenase/arogenate dehydrogenase family protein [Candidatus Limnocylindrales bacterium]